MSIIQSCFEASLWVSLISLIIKSDDFALFASIYMYIIKCFLLVIHAGYEVCDLAEKIRNARYRVWHAMIFLSTKY